MKSHRFFTLFLTFLFAVLVLPGFSRTIDFPQAQVSAQIPDKWIIEPENGAYTIKSPDGGSVSLAMVPLEATDMEKAVDEAEKTIFDGIGQLTPVSEAQTGEMNGMKYVETQATAMNGQISVSLTLILTPAEKWLMVAYFGAVNKEALWQKDVAFIASSVKPVKSDSALNKLKQASSFFNKAKTSAEPVADGKGSSTPVNSDVKTGAKSFPAPFTEDRAITLLFSAPGKDGEAIWNPPANVKAKVDPNPGRSKASTKCIGFHRMTQSEDTDRILVAFQTSFPDAQPEIFAPLIGAAIFDFNGETAKLVWFDPAILQTGDVEAGVNPKFVQVGRGISGVLVEGSGMRQGITTVVANLLVVYKDKVVKAAEFIPVHEDNEGEAEDPSNAYSYDTSIEFVEGSHDDYYDMVVKFKGTTYEYDAANNRKIVPADFKRVWTWADSGVYEEEPECDN